MENDLLMRTAGALVALEFAVKALIETHPDRARLNAVWNQHSTDLIDAGMENPLYSQVSSFRDGVNGQLARLTALLATG
jgi:hypothetical protein